MQLEPAEYFGIVRQLADPSDTGTYYIRAVVRDARTDATLDTVNLASKGNGRYSAEWRVYASGKALQGMYVSITTYVYADSGYTTLDTNYGAESETYLLEPRAKHTGGGGGGVSVNYNRISEIVGGAILGSKVEPITKEDIKKIVEDAIKKIEMPETDMAPVMDAIRGIDIQPNVSVKVNAPKVDTETIASRLNEEVSGAIAEKLSGSSLQTITDSLIAATEKKIEEMMSGVFDESIKNASESIREAAKKIEEGMVKDIIASTVGAMRKNDEPIPSPFQGISTGELIREALKKKK